jgi:hypothetical protein
MAKCSFCEKPLPEAGFTHYLLVESLGTPRPACIECRRRLHLVMVDLRKDEQ